MNDQAPTCSLRVRLDHEGFRTESCLVVRDDGEVVGQLPVTVVRMKMTAGEVVMMRCDIAGKWAKVEYAPEPVGPYTGLVAS